MGGDDIRQDILITLSKSAQLDELCSVLEQHGIPTTKASSVEEASHSLKSHSTTFLLLDMEMEGARSFLDDIASSYYMPQPYLIIVTNSFSESESRTAILNRGADACLQKPLDAKEVLAIINAVLRRSARFTKVPTRCAARIVRKDLSIDPARHTVTMEGREVNLTKKEFDILYFLASYPGIVFSKDKIYENIWEDDSQFSTTNVFDHISSLRRKLGLSAKDTRYIETVFGSGYRFVQK